MKIIFNLQSCGLGNNGGSSTIVKSANALVDLGHQVTILDSGKNQHSWTPLKADHIRGDPPDADAVIATGYKTVGRTLKLPDRCGVKYHWIRGWETWQMRESEIHEKILKTPTIKLVNSICLQKKLNSFGVESTIIRPGHDFNQLFPTHQGHNRDCVVLGGLYNTRHNSKRTNWIFDAVRLFKFRYRVKLWMFGASSLQTNSDIVDEYVKNPAPGIKNEIYNGCDIWLAPTTNEGLHICPAEAMLTECPVVGTDAEMSGMQDYLFDGVTGLVSSNDLNQFCKRIEYLIRFPDKRIKYGQAARNQILSMGDRQSNMKKLVQLISGSLYENI